MASSLTENLDLAWDTLRSHKTRSALTILGVFVGTVTLMAIGSILTGMNNVVVNEMKGFGTDTIFVYKFEPGRFKPPNREERMRKPISDQDIEAVREYCGACEAISPEVMVWRDWKTPDSIKYRSHLVQNLQLSGAMPVYPEVLNRDIGEGRFFTDVENEHRAMVTVIGDTISKALFPDEDPIGKEVLVNGETFTVVGTFAKTKSVGNEQDKAVVVPYDTYKKLYPMATEHFFAAAAFPGRMNDAIDQIREALRRSRRDKWNQPDSFGIATADSIIGNFHSITSTVALVIVVVASIGMLIGGVGVMNIMLASVTERTREIGVRKAIGARRRDIIQQFLLEAVFLTGFGGLSGIVGGWLISLIINYTLPNLPSQVPLWAVVMGFGVSVAIGLFFGLFPAMKAARLDPVVALRYE
jgi:putative ABC transport system permease protein